VSRGNVHSVSVQCAAGLHAIGGTATVTWDYEASAPQGEIIVKSGGNTTSTPLNGSTGQQTFVIGDEWTVSLYADASRYPSCTTVSCFPVT
jgi:hypothetical protein